MAGAVLTLTLGGCQEHPAPIRLGFIASVKATAGDHDRAGRDGALLAVNEINAAGGVGGSPLELIVVDDEFRPERAQMAVRSLVAKGVSAIVGPMTSQMAVAVAAAANEEKIVVLSPAASTESLAGHDDYFFRVYPLSSIGGEALAGYFLQQKASLVHIVKDVTNAAHTEEFAASFLKRFADGGGQLGGIVDFDPREESSLSDVVQRLPIAMDDEEVIVVLSTPPNVGIIAQVLRRRIDNRRLGASEWAASNSLLAFGGSAVEGLAIAKVFLDSDRTGAAGTFRSAFLTRFYYEPNFSAACAYESVQVLAKALAKARSRSEVKDALLSSGPYEGFRGPFMFDAFGDVHRPMSVLVIQDGAFQRPPPGKGG